MTARRRQAGSESTAGPGRVYRPDIDGLRAIAVSAVVAYHVGAPGIVSGFVGVDVFFVISGFLIGRIILAETRADCFSFAAFYARRARRIVPALLCVLLFTLLVGALILSPSEFARVGATAATAATGTSNFYFWQDIDYFAPNAALNPLLMTWSLGVEEQFYLAFPWILFASSKYSRTLTTGVLLVLTLASFVLSLWCTGRFPGLAFYLLPARAWELGIGCLLASTRVENDAATAAPGGSLGRDLGQELLGGAGLLLITASATRDSLAGSFPGWASLTPAAGAAALLLSERSFINRRILSSKPLVFVGVISYSWYLWHWPLIAFVRNCSAGTPHARGLIGAAALSFLIACASYRWIEQPFRRRLAPPVATLKRYGVAVAAMLCTTLLVMIGHGWPERVSRKTAAIDQMLEVGRKAPCLTAWGQPEPDRSPACMNEQPGRASIAVLGDSHAGALWPAVRKLAEENGWGSVVFAQGACRPLLGVSVWRRDHPALYAECASFMQGAIAGVADDPQVRTVLLVCQWGSPYADSRVEHLVATDRLRDTRTGDQLQRDGLRSLIDLLVARGKQVIVFGDTPLWSFDPGRAELIEAIPVRRVLARPLHGMPQAADLHVMESDWNATAERITKSFAARGNVRFLNLYGRFCTSGQCVYRAGETLFFVDHSHLSPQGSDYALSGFDLFHGD